MVQPAHGAAQTYTFGLKQNEGRHGYTDDYLDYDYGLFHSKMDYISLEEI